MLRRHALFAIPLLVVGCAAPTEDVGETNESSEALTTVTPSAQKVEGIDVSHYQGAIDWKAEKAKGRLFAIASVGDGTYEDPSFATNWAGMKSAGVIRGAYQFFEPSTDPLVQADIVVKKLGKLGDGDLPATIDVEKTGGQTPAAIAAAVQKWLTRVEAGTGKKPIIYTGPYFWQDNVKSTAFGKYPLWIADYGVTQPLIPAGWTKMTMWQYSDSNGALDLDRFQGTLAELQAFAATPKTAPSTSPDGGATEPAPSEPPADPEPSAASSDPAPKANAAIPAPPTAGAQGGCTMTPARDRTDVSFAPIALIALAIAARRRR